MGDRVSCQLFISGVLTPEEAEILDELLENEFEPDQRAVYEFEEVNNGNIDPDLSDFLEQKNMSYIWRWGGGQGFDPGLVLHDAKTRTTDQFLTSGDDVVVTVRDLDNPAIIAAARAADQASSAKWTVVVADSAHGLLDLISAGTISEQDADLFQARFAA
jgi:hypothetical protein